MLFPGWLLCRSRKIRETDGRCRSGKEDRAMKKRLSCILLMVFLLLKLTGVCADPDLALQDPTVQSGPWRDAYARILQERSPGIHAYEDYVISITYLTQCRPVGLTDLTGDGIPELIFLDLVTDTEYGFNVGRLWIYTSDESGVHCALSLQPEIDDLLYSSVFCGNGGLLTLYFSDTEITWTMCLQPDKAGCYKAETILTAQEDFSGEGPDQYYLNGRQISAKEYRSESDRIQSAQGSQVGSLMVDEGFCGFTRTLEEAQHELSSAGPYQTPHPDSGNSKRQDDGQSAGQLPELSFFPGTFPPGQKYAVYSSPSSRSWRGARGKAAITSGSEILVAGTDGSWILVFYELDSGVARVGYINTEKIAGPYFAGEALSFAKIRTTLTKTTEMTDDPVHQKSVIGKLKKGTAVTCLAEYRGWIYAEVKISGKTARGFISPSALGAGINP